MSGENNYEVHVALTGLQEVLSGLETFESRLRTVGQDQKVGSGVISEVASAKAAVLSLESQVQASAQKMASALASGMTLRGHENFTSEIRSQVEAALQPLAKIRDIISHDKIALNFDAEAMARQVTNAIVKGTTDARNQLTHVGTSVGGLTAAEARATTGTTAGLTSALNAATARALEPSLNLPVNSVNPESTRASQEALAATRHAVEAQDQVTAGLKAQSEAVRLYTQKLNEKRAQLEAEGISFHTGALGVTAIKDGQQVGALPYSRTQYGDMKVGDAFVDSGFRGQGIYSVLRDSLYQEASRQGVGVQHSDIVNSQVIDALSRDPRVGRSGVDSLGTPAFRYAPAGSQSPEDVSAKIAASDAARRVAFEEERRALEEARAAEFAALDAQAEKTSAEINERIARITAERLTVESSALEAARRDAQAKKDSAENDARNARANARGGGPITAHDLSDFDGGRGGGSGGSGGGIGGGGFPPGGHFPDEGVGLPTPDEAVELVKRNLASRISEARGAGFVLPDYTGPGQSPYFDLIPSKTHKDGSVDPEFLRRVTTSPAIQALADDPTTEAGRRRQQEAFAKSLGALIQAQNEEAVQLLENRGLLKKQSTAFSRADDGTFIRRTGPRAGTPITDSDPSYLRDFDAAQTAQVRSATSEAATRKKIERLNETSTLGGTFLGGFTSKGFENPGQGILPALVGTAGVLSRYALDGAVIGGVTIALKDTLQEAEAYQKALVELNEAASVTNSGQIKLNGAFAEGAKYGLDQATAVELGTAGIRNYATEIQNGANATDVFTESVKQAGINAVLTGQKAAESQKQLLAITNEFGTGYKGQAEVNDSVFNSSLRFNATPAEIQKSLVENGDLANVAGFSQQRLAATSAAIIGQGLSPTGLTRLLARGGNQQFQGAISSLGVTNTGNIADELDKASESYAKLSNAQKAAFAEQSGGARSAAILIALLKEQSAINDSVAESYTEGGKAAQTALDLQNTAAGQIKVFFTDLKNLGGDIAKSGVVDILGLVLEILKNGVEIADGFVQVLDKANGPLKHLLITAGELYVLFRAIRSLSEGAAGEKTFAGGLSALGSKIRNKSGNEASEIPGATKVAATEIGEAGTTLAATIEAAAAKIAEASGVEYAARVKGAEKVVEGDVIEATARKRGAAEVAVSDAEESAARKTGGLGGLLASIGLGSVFAKGAHVAPSGIFGTSLGEAAPLAAGGLVLGAAAMVIADGVFIDKAIRATQRQIAAKTAANEAGSTGQGDSAQLGQDARDASSLAQKARASSGGFIGTLENGVSVAEGFGGTGSASRRANATAAELAREAQRQSEAEASFGSRLGLAGNFNLNSPDFSKGVQDLQGQGLSMSEIGAQESKFLDEFAARSAASRSFLSVGQGDILAGKIANTTTSNLRQTAQFVGETGADNLNGTNIFSLSGNEKIANFNKDKQKSLNDALNKSTQDFIASNNLEGKDLAKLDKGTLDALAKANKDALKKQLKTLGLSDEEIKALDKSISLEAKAAIGSNAFNINDKSGAKLTPAQVADAIKNAGAVAKGAGTTAGLNEALNGGIGSDQQGADLRAQLASLQEQRRQLGAVGDPNADFSVLDEEIQQAKLDLANQTGTQIKAMSKYATDLLSPLDVSGRIQAQLKGLSAAIKTDKGQALRDDLDQQAQLQFQAHTRANVTAPTAAEALTLDTRSTLSAPKLALDNAQRDLDDAKAQHADQATLDQKQQAVRQARQAYTSAQIADANAQELGNVALGDKVGELKAKYDGLIAQAGNQTGGQAAQTLRDAQQTYIDGLNAQADITGKEALSGLDPRDKIGALRQTLKNLRGKVFAVGDTGGQADNVTQQKVLEQQIRDAENARVAAIANSKFDVRDTTGLAKQAVANALTNLHAQLPGSKEYADALIAYHNAQIAYATSVRGVSDAAEESKVFSGDALGEAKSKVDAANRNLAAAKKGTAAYYQALKGQRDAQIAYAAEVDAAKDILRELSGDRTDPIFQANEELRKAKEKLARDNANRAPTDVINKDTLDVQDKAVAAQKAALDRQLSLAGTQRQLNQISLAQYLDFLNGQDKALRTQLAATKQGSEGYAQLVDEINTVDQAIQSANQSASGQFNLGDIKLPTAYQVRRNLPDAGNDPSVFQPINVLNSAVVSLATPAQLAAQQIDSVTLALTNLQVAAARVNASFSGGGTATTNHISINGADFAKVVQFLESVLGSQSKTVAASGRKA